ncbi:MAG: ThiF family adenylyltransferase [Bacilli bacterium]|jgi:tRNA A37 threonylcarbamoyladenosine dehydratase|nr:ThiF family adenylyltransferase [Bacilli bacterium]
MDKRLERTASLIGEENIKLFKDKTVLVCGLGGVGGTALESLARSGIGNFIIVDFDVVDITNLNRQILFVSSDIGMLKVEASKNRIQAIHKEIRVRIVASKVNRELLDMLSVANIDFIIDAIDSPKAKVELIKFALRQGIPFISSLGMANRLDPTAIRITDLEKTETDPLAKKMRTLMRKEKIELSRVPVVYSLEKPIIKGPVLASVMNVPSAAGLALAFYCLEKIQNWPNLS